MSYKTIRKNTVIEFEEKKSLFIASLKRVESEEVAKEFIAEIKAKHKEASHNVYAYIIGANRGVQRYSDDGEPQGTAGIPVLEVIKRNEVTDIAVVVTRYFGGVLLGAGGLCRAYAKGASKGINDAGVVEKVFGFELKITIGYDLLGILQYKFNENNWHIENTEYTDNVTINTYVEEGRLEVFEDALRVMTGNRHKILKGDKTIFLKEMDRLYRL
jgi:uncharacterized YigZ family protein